jgi:hypothetical protein
MTEQPKQIMKRLTLVLLCTLLAIISSQAANIYFVSFHSADGTPSAAAATAMFTNAPDVGYTQLLAANGHTVTRVVSSDAPDTNLLNAADLVIISRSVPSGNFELDPETAAWNGITAPMMILGGYVLRNSRLGFTTGTTIPDVNSNPVRLTVNNPAHPIFAGVALDGANTMVNPYAVIVTHTNWTQRGISVNNNPVAGGGTILATVGTAGDPAFGGMVIGEWQAGAVLGNSPPDTLGGHRLVLLTGSRESAGLTSEGSGIYDLDTDGAQLFLNAVTYMTGGGGGGRIVTVNTTNNESPGPSETSLLEALSDLQDGDTIRFNIAGAGPHVIVTPIGGYPLITNHNVTIDGYSQPGATPNTNPILGGNNAQIKIVLDSTGTETLPNPDPMFPNRPLRRSTRLDFPTFVGNTGYGESENGVLAVFEADNITIRGLSFIGRYGGGTEEDPGIYSIALVNQATNAHVSGCWFGIAPGGSTMADLKPLASAVSAFRWRIPVDVYSEGLIFGTDGDGVNDRAEFNVALGAHIALALELPRARVSGNYINVFPNGLTFVNVDELALQIQNSIEFLENGRFANDTTIGTDGNGMSDSDERNIVGTHSVYDHDIEIYTAGTNIVVAGNYFGVGIDGVTAGPVTTNETPNFIGTPGSSTIRIGSNGDGVSDQLEGNLIVNVPGSFFSESATALLVHRGNRMINNGFAKLSQDATTAVPTLNPITNNILSGTNEAPMGEYIAAFIDVYTVDPIALANTNFWPAPVVHTLTWLGTLTDGATNDLDPDANEFAFDLAPFGIASSNYVTVAVTYSKEANASNAGLAFTGRTAGPVAARPTINVQLVPGPAGQLAVLSWIAPENSFIVQQNNGFDPLGWLELLTPPTYTEGRNVLETPYDAFGVLNVFRLISAP